MGLLLPASRHGTGTLLLALLPAVLLISGGIRSLLFPDLRAPQISAIGSVAGALLALPLGLAGGAELGLVALALSLLGLLSSGWFSIRQQPPLDGVPAPRANPLYCLQVALDNTISGFMAALTPDTDLNTTRAAVAEAQAAHDLLAAGGYLADPASFHSQPPPVEETRLVPLKVAGTNCEHLQFESGFEVLAGLPGAERWSSYEENHTCHALLLRAAEPAPWLVCVHGFGMGDYQRDFKAFRAAELHREQGVNIALFTLPVHGPRSPAGFNGEKFFGASILDFIHGVSHAVWDLRRLIGWLRSDARATSVGVLGLSLGGYTSAVLAAVEDDLACAIVGVPPTDMVAHRHYLDSPYQARLARIAGVSDELEREVYRVVAPLQLAPRVVRERRYMFAATGDQFVPLEQVQALWQHWGQPQISWCTGGHVSALLQRAPRQLIDRAVAESLAPGRN